MCLHSYGGTVQLLQVVTIVWVQLSGGDPTRLAVQAVGWARVGEGYL